MSIDEQIEDYRHKLRGSTPYAKRRLKTEIEKLQKLKASHNYSRP